MLMNFDFRTAHGVNTGRRLSARSWSWTLTSPSQTLPRKRRRRRRKRRPRTRRRARRRQRKKRTTRKRKMTTRRKRTRKRWGLSAFNAFLKFYFHMTCSALYNWRLFYHLLYFPKLFWQSLLKIAGTIKDTPEEKKEEEKKDEEKEKVHFQFLKTKNNNMNKWMNGRLYFEFLFHSTLQSDEKEDEKKE